MAAGPRTRRAAAQQRHRGAGRLPRAPARGRAPHARAPASSRRSPTTARSCSLPRVDGREPAARGPRRRRRFDALIAAHQRAAAPRDRHRARLLHATCAATVLDAVGAVRRGVRTRLRRGERPLRARQGGRLRDPRVRRPVRLAPRQRLVRGRDGRAARPPTSTLLGRRHPRYHDDVQRFIRDNPLAEAAGERSLPARAPRAPPRPGPAVGPARRPVRRPAPRAGRRHAAARARPGARARAAARGASRGRPERTCTRRRSRTATSTARVAHVFPPRAGDAAATDDRFALADPARERAFAALLDALDVGAAHLHHLSGWPARIWRELEARGIPFAFTVHDYLCTCPSFYRLDLATWHRLRVPRGRRRRRRAVASTSFLDACGLAPPGRSARPRSARSAPSSARCSRPRRRSIAPSRGGARRRRARASRARRCAGR